VAARVAQMLSQESVEIRDHGIRYPHICDTQEMHINYARGSKAISRGFMVATNEMLMAISIEYS
jgi:hypothetical protein